ncbi:vitellogenin-1-like [Zeugodacus cucurbitae]|uniref:vitellogenin-1-like n=1 Tax=Zeugodacus cucurbitae TaxID=28588 RepID=UPI000596A79B|nr:vitellogenin-1-like [Zeugodacus cucurbitae]
MARLHISVIALLFISLVVATHAQSGIFNIPHLLESAGAIVKGAIKDGRSYIPTPEGIFESSKNLLAGYPLEVVSSAINTICSSGLATRTMRSLVKPDLRKMQFQLRTTCNKHSYPLLDANQIWRSPEFDPSKKVVILVTGWTTTVNDTDTIDVLAKAYNCRGDVNFVAVDVGNYVNSLYTWAAMNTEDIGKSLAEGIDLLTQVVPLENIHLIGHSLGAHIVGTAGRYFNYKTGKLVPRITGLDTAKPCFNEGHALSGLHRGNAKFIDVIHSNPGVMGKREALGDVDFYPGGLDPLPKGCLTVLCAHARSWEYYAESVYPGNEREERADLLGRVFNRQVYPRTYLLA